MLQFNRTMKSSKAGFSLMELMVAAALLGIVLYAYMSYRQLLMRTMNETKVRHTLESVRNDLKARLADTDSWCANVYQNSILDAGLTPSSRSNLSCILNRVRYYGLSTDPTIHSKSIICNRSDIKDPIYNLMLNFPGTSLLASTASATPCNYVPSDTRSIRLYDLSSVVNASPVIFYDSSDPTQGFSLEGIPCKSFDATAGGGSESCPLRYNITWNLECPDASGAPCTCHTVVVKAQLQVNFPNAATDKSYNWVNNLNTDSNGFTEIRIPIERCGS